jgi:hypothetical protein
MQTTTHRTPSLLQQYADSLNSRPAATGPQDQHLYGNAFLQDALRGACGGGGCHQPGERLNTSAPVDGFMFDTRACTAMRRSASWAATLASASIEHANGGTRIGPEMSAHAFKTDLPMNDQCTLQAQVLAASYDSTVGTDGATAGLGAEFGSVAVDCTNAQASEVDEVLWRFGLSEGLGFAGRAHWGDTDGDRRPEIGLGFDVGPVSAIAMTERPSRFAGGLL